MIGHTDCLARTCKSPCSTVRREPRRCPIELLGRTKRAILLNEVPLSEHVHNVLGNALRSLATDANGHRPA